MPIRNDTPAWQENAAYRDWVDIFDATFARTRSRVASAAASAICAACPVRRACLDDVLRFESSASNRYGVRAGLTPSQRAKLATSRV